MTKRRYVSVYRVYRCYGGPEEGGWWYDTYERITSVATSKVKLESTYRKLKKKWESQNTRPLHSVLNTGSYCVLKERNIGEHETKEIPYYC